MRCRLFGSTAARSGAWTSSAALAVLALLLVGWVTWVALFAALLVPLVMGMAALMRPALMRQAPPRPFDPSRYPGFDGPFIEGEYRVLPPER